MLFETHAHLSDPKFDADRDAVIQRAIDGGIQTIIEIADGPSEWEKARVLSEKYPDHIWWAAGLHPYFADQASPSLWDELKKLATHPRFVAVGEIGLDYAKCPIPHDVQIETFKQAILVAIDVRKPLIIHCREAYEDLMPILRKSLSVLQSTFNEGPPGVVHCFSGDQSNAKELVQMGFFLGIDGPLTYPSANPLRSALESIPLEKLVLETDSPYLPPQSFRGKRNEPAYLSYILEKLSTLRGMSQEVVGKAVTKNGQTLFRLN